MIKKYVKKPIEVEAVQFDGENWNELFEFTGNDTEKTSRNFLDKEFRIHTLEGTMLAYPGDYIIKGIKGEFYPCKSDIFEESYEEIK